MKVFDKIFALNKMVRMNEKQLLIHFKVECLNIVSPASIRGKNSCIIPMLRGQVRMLQLILGQKQLHQLVLGQKQLLLLILGHKQLLLVLGQNW
jgi:hypothetical protein